MKCSNLCILVISLISIPFSVLAVDSVSESVNEDLFFPRGVLLEGVEGPENNEATTGSSSVTIEGVGTITVADAKLGSFPRMMVSGGTTITSRRVWTDETLRKSWWEGQFTAPSSGRVPSWGNIEFSAGQREGNGEKIVDSFLWGLPNETFTYSPSAAVVLPVTEKTNVKLYAAFPEGTDGTYLVDKSKYCVVQDGLCALEIDEVNSITLVKETWTRCPRKSVKNGRYGGTPDCSIICDRGYELNADATSCVGTGGDDLMIDEEEATAVESPIYNEAEGMEEATPEVRNGYIRYRGSRAQLNPSIDEEEITDVEKLTTARRNNAATSIRSNEEELENKNVAGEEEGEDGFLNYLLQMRNRYEDHNVNDFTDYGNIETDETDEEVEEKAVAYSSSAQLLPSTGPELFAILAISGLVLMVFGVARKRN